MQFLHDLKAVVNRSPALQKLSNLSKAIVEIIPYYLVEEKKSDQVQASLTPKLDLRFLTTRPLAPSDIVTIARHPEVPETEERLLQRLDSGWIALGVFYKDEIVAYMWGNIKECDSRLLPFKLKENEAYLTDARTFTAYRGKRLAPYLRCRFYDFLHQSGRTRLYSITQYLNKPAFRFKQKLDAVPIRLNLWICLFRTLRCNIVLKRFKRTERAF